MLRRGYHRQVDSRVQIQSITQCSVDVNIGVDRQVDSRVQIPSITQCSMDVTQGLPQASIDSWVQIPGYYSTFYGCWTEEATGK